MAVTELPPPAATIGPLAWLRRNLFSSPANALVTLVLGGGLGIVLVVAIEWAVTRARWGVITANFRLFLMYVYPFEHAWRVWLCLALLSLIAGLSAAHSRTGPLRTLAVWLTAGQLLLAALAALSAVEALLIGAREARAEELLIIAGGLLVNAGIGFAALTLGRAVRLPDRLIGLLWLAWLPASLLLLQGVGDGLLDVVATNLWGGLLLTFLLAVASIVLSFPIGVLLALGRRSDLPVIKWLCTAYIEVVRGVPLVTILFMAAVMLPLFLPGGLRIDHLYRAIAGLTMFTAAYVAENVRGGLQAIPLGQIEAANAIGLNAIQRNLYIVLPQALRAVIPANVGLFISLLKDTTLVAIAGTGLLELLGIGQAVLAQSQWVGTYMEVYLFISAVFFVMCYTMSQASYRLETAMGVGRR
jgi:general L-amino acid transport system permease protein